MLVLYAHSNANGSIAAAVMEKVLISGVLERTFAVESVDLVVTPNSIAGMACGSKVAFTYAATFHVPMDTAGGTIEFSTPRTMDASRQVQVSPSPGQSTATYSFTTSGTLEPDLVYPGIAEIQVSSPNVINSPPVKLAGTCS